MGMAASGLSCIHGRVPGGEERPNILMLTCEDIGPHLGCYGDAYADTPNLDALAAKGLIYRTCWSNGPVCAPARTTLISGLYPPCTGAEHMRSETNLPDGFRMYPQYLRAAGYYCTNNHKEDYNLAKPGTVWDASDREGHWRNRAPGQPFFAVFNCTATHEGNVRARPHEAVHDPAGVRVPAYHPDRPEVRQDWAQYYDTITELDTWAGERLRELDEAGLAEDTVVIFFSDHGAGMPRNKRWPYDSGLHVPLIVYVPPRFRGLAPKGYQPGGASDRLVGFIDMAPAVLSLAGIEPPEVFQGHAFMGRFQAPDPPYLYGFRGRMDERYDLVRTVRSPRYVYVRNYMPHKIYGQYIRYMFQTPTTRIWKALHERGEVTPAQRTFWERKAPEELYDLEQDPDEVQNLAGLPEYREVLEEMRKAHREWVLRIRDVGFLPEDEIHARAAGRSPYEVGHDPAAYPLERILETAEAASSLKEEAVPALVRGLDDEDSAVRYWAAIGLLAREEQGVRAGREALLKVLAGDPSPSARIMAAEALGRYGEEEDLIPALGVLVHYADAEHHSAYAALLALNALDALGDRAVAAAGEIERLSKKECEAPPRFEGYSDRLFEKMLGDSEDS